MGFTKVCNSDKTTIKRTALCPAEREVRGPTEIQCACLQTRVVEQDLLDGVNPLGLRSKDCYQVPSEMVYLVKKSGKNMRKKLTIFKFCLQKTDNNRDSIWNQYIEEYVSSAPGEERQGLEDVLTETLEVEERHESRVNSLGKATEYNR